MTIEIRQGNRAGYFEVFEGEEKIGELFNHLPERGDDSNSWSVQLWTLAGTGKTWDADGCSYEEVAGCAEELYREGFVAERRELTRGPRPHVISTPMGGQRRK